MMNFTELASVPSDRPMPFTDQLRLAVTAYLARFKGSSRDHTESDDLGEEHGHRVLRVCGKGTKVALIPLTPAVGRAIDRAIGTRTRGPILLNRSAAEVLARVTQHPLSSVLG